MEQQDTSEKLKEVAKPIIACVGTLDEYGEDVSHIVDLESVATPVDYFAHEDILNGRNHKNIGSHTYVISTFNESSKYTVKLFDCTSLIIAGESVDNGAEMSLLTHQDPKQVLYGRKRELFTIDLKESLREVKDLARPGTIDVVIVGGNLSGKYTASIELLKSLVQEILGLVPTVIVGPKEDWYDNVYFDNATRRLFVLRPKDGGRMYNGSFKANQMPKEIKDEEDSGIR